MLSCCGLRFYAAEKIVLPKKDKLYRALEFAYCPNCNAPSVRFVEQDYNYDIHIKEQRGIKALRLYEKCRKQREKYLATVISGTKAGQNYYYGTFKKTKRFDEMKQPIYVQVRKNFNNQAEELGDVITHYFKL